MTKEEDDEESSNEWRGPEGKRNRINAFCIFNF